MYAMRHYAGAELVRVHADDPDEGPSGHVTYAFTDHVRRVYGDLFRVDADTGTIYLKTVLDYEKSASYHLTVTATDLGTPPSLPATAKVSLVHFMLVSYDVFLHFVAQQI